MRRSAVLLALLALAACKEQPKPDETPKRPPVQPGTIDDKLRDESVRPVYPTTNVTPVPLAERLCAALHTWPRQRFAECCKRQPGVVLTSECVRNLSAALTAKAVALEEKAVGACEAAIKDAHQGCDWIGPWNPPLPPACSGIVQGSLAKGAKCRSSLECGAGLRCLGVGPTDVGVCGEPQDAGRLCGTAVDALVVYTRQDDYESVHPPCKGYCDRNRCTDTYALGAECKTNAHCGRGNRCKNGKCVEGARAKDGESCLGGDCELGLRCVSGKCQVPRPLGAACTVDQECKAACEAGTCAQRCDTMPQIRPGMGPTVTSTKSTPASR